MIPKKIHYCWFGGAEIPEHDQKCIDSWKNYCPDYEIIRWDESNYNYKKNQYMSQAYEAKKWGFVTDYARLDIIYENGGVYFDTDVELVRNIDDLLDNQAFMGFDASGESVASGLGLGAEEHFPLYREMLQEIYGKRVFKLGIGDYDTTPCPRLTDDFLKKRGLLQNNCIQNVMGLTIYPSEWLCPIDDVTGDFCTTENTHSIHHFHASWLTPEEKKEKYIIQRFIARFGMETGTKIGRIAAKPYRIKMHLRTKGIKGTVAFAIRKILRKEHRGWK